MNFVQYDDILISIIVKMTIAVMLIVPSVISAVLVLRNKGDKKTLHDTALKSGMLGPNQKLF